MEEDSSLKIFQHCLKWQQACREREDEHIFRLTNMISRSD